MSTGTEQWTPKNAAASAETVERPAWMSQRTAVTEPSAEESPLAAAETQAESTLYCDQCWAPLSPTVEECPDCGRILAEMRAEQARQSEEDRKWRPPRAGKPAYRTPEMRKKKAKRVQAAEQSDIAVPAGLKRGGSLDLALAFERAKPLLTVVGVGFLLGGVAVLSFWFSIATYH